MIRNTFNVILTVVILSGCTTEPSVTPPTYDPAGSEARAQLAYESLENQFQFWATSTFRNATDYDRLNFQAANTLYKEALSLNPNNLHANFGAAITEILIAYSDTAINNAVKRWETFLNSGGFGSSFLNSGLPTGTDKLAPPVALAAANIMGFHKAALQDPPLISQMQQILRDRLLPRISYALQRLAVVEADTGFRFRVSGKMQGDPQLRPVYLYVTEIYFTDAMLQWTRVMLEEFLVYRFDLPDYSQASLVNALQQNNTTFFVLASDGVTRAQNAKAAFQAMIDKTQSGIGALETISGYRSDAAIKIGSSGIRQRDLDTLKTYLQRIRTSLTAPISVFLKGADSEGNDYTIQVHLGQFFDNPPQNPKSQFLPTYTVEPSGTRGVALRFTAANYSQFTFPDPTLGGILPGMTNETLKRLLWIDAEFAYDWRGYAYFEGGYWAPIANATVKIQTSARTYTKQTDQWGNFRFLILDADNVQYQAFINYGTGDVELIGTESLVIRAKTRVWYSIVVPQAPSNLSATRDTIRLGVYLSWTPQQGGYYVIQKGVGSGSIPVDIDSSWYYGYYNDYNVVGGQTYSYRIRTQVGSPYYWGLRPRLPFYSSIVEIVP